MPDLFEPAQVHVLLADGDDVSRRHRETQLSRLGAKVSAAKTAFGAIVKASYHLPDVILLDDGLPDIGAMEAGRMITTCPATSHIPILSLAPGRPLPRRVLSLLRRGTV